MSSCTCSAYVSHLPDYPGCTLPVAAVWLPQLTRLDGKVERGPPGLWKVTEQVRQCTLIWSIPVCSLSGFKFLGTQGGQTRMAYLICRWCCKLPTANPAAMPELLHLFTSSAPTVRFVKVLRAESACVCACVFSGRKAV